MTFAVRASATPPTATWPLLVRLHALPAASVMMVAEPAATVVSLGDATGFTGTGLVDEPPAH